MKMADAANKNIDILPGKNRLITHFFLIVFFQLILYSSIVITIYSILTFNFQFLAILLLICWLQSYITKSDTYIKWVQKYIHPLWYYKRFVRIYDQPDFQEDLTMFCYHPHSVLPYSMAANLNADDSRLSKAKALGSRFILNAPIFGMILRLWGVEAVDPNHMKKLMRDQKVSISLVPGGYQQATLTSPNQLKLFIKNRKGFVKYALKYGYSIRPVLVYNEHKGFKTFTLFEKFRLMLNKLKMPGVIFGGGFLWVFFPLNIELVTIVGRGIKRKSENHGTFISQQEIDEIHSEYIEEIKRLHNKYRKEYGESELLIY